MRNRNAFTLVELLVVIAIIGVLVALLLPAVQSAREAARKVQCQNNVKQLALALHVYHDTNDTFPPSAHWDDISKIRQVNYSGLNENWVIMILPQMEQQALYDAFDLDQPIPSPINETARSTELDVMLCPTDTLNRVKFNGSRYNYGDNWARGNYGANASLNKMGLQELEDFRSAGVMLANLSFGIAEIGDGTTNTILIAELRAGVVDFDCRGTWAMSGGCPSALWAHGAAFDANGPNSLEIGADDLNGCSDVHAEVGGPIALVRDYQMGCPAGSRANYQQTSRSLHPGGVYTALCDGSVKWISNFIDIAGTRERLSVWDRINVSQDGLYVESDSF